MGVTQFFAGYKVHIVNGGNWTRGGLRFSFSDRAHLDVGADMFVGGAETYFGEWRSNDRLFAALNWWF